MVSPVRVRADSAVLGLPQVLAEADSAAEAARPGLVALLVGVLVTLVGSWDFSRRYKTSVIAALVSTCSCVPWTCWNPI